MPYILRAARYPIDIKHVQLVYHQPSHYKTKLKSKMLSINHLVNCVIILHFLHLHLSTCSAFDPRLVSERFSLLCNATNCHHGKCLLERCICHPGWAGIDCDEFVQQVLPCTDLNCFIEETGQFVCNSDSNDTCRLNIEYGVLSAPDSRWTQAQLAEFTFWNESSTETDRNDRHADGFNKYSVLPNNLGRVLEIGSGPFTQLKTILQLTNASVDSITLLEPLAMKYKSSVKGCSYKNDTMFGNKVNYIVSSAEEAYFGETYDTAIMINTIEHAKDGLLVLKNLYHAIKPGGLLIIHEMFYDEYTGRPMELGPFLDFVFHPIRIKSKLWNYYLSHFEKIYYSEFNQPFVFNDVDIGVGGVVQNNGFYCIAKKPIVDIGWQVLLGKAL